MRLKKNLTQGVIEHHLERINTLERLYKLRFEDISEETVYNTKQIMLDKGLSPRYINDMLYTINTYSEFAGISLHFKKLSIVRKVPKYLTQQQIQILLKNPNVRNRAIINLLYFCGLRAGEVCALKLEDIEENKLWIRDPKNKIEDYVVMNNEAQRNLQAWLNIHEGHTDYVFYTERTPYLRYDVIRAMFCKLSRELGFKVTAHMLRHSIATHIAENGGNEYDIQAHLRHKSVRSTEIYVHITSKKNKT